MANPDSNVSQAVFGDPRPLSEENTTQIEPEYLPTIIAEYAAHCSIASGIDISSYAMACLAACSGVASDSFRIDCQPGSHWYERPKFWVALVAPPGWGKTPVFRAARSRIEEIQSRLIADNVSQRIQYQEALDEYAKLRPKERGPRPVRPREILAFIDEVTPQYAKQVLMDNPRGVLMIQDELDGILSSTDSESRKWVTDMLSLYDGGMRTKGTKKDGSDVVKNWSAAFITTVQPEVIKWANKSFLAKGFLQRFVPVMMGEPNRPTPGHTVPRLRFDDLISQLWRMDSDEPFIFSLSESGYQIVNEYRDTLFGIKVNQHLDPYLRQHLSKHEGLVFRLSLLFHVIELAAAGGTAENDLEAWRIIPDCTVVAAINLLQRYVTQSARSFYGGVVGSSGAKALATQLIAYFKSRVALGDLQLASGDLVREVWPWRQAAPVERQNAMALLTSNCWCAVTKEKTGSKPKTVIILNPKIGDMARLESAHAVRDIKIADALLDC